MLIQVGIGFFSLPIKGLITKYGGPNSHMAIRAAEKKYCKRILVSVKIYSNKYKNQKLLK